MYKLATGHWLFTPEGMDEISRDVVHLARMIQRTGQDHDGAALKQHGTRKKHHDLKRTPIPSNLFTFIISRHVEARSCGGGLSWHRLNPSSVGQ